MDWPERLQVRFEEAFTAQGRPRGEPKDADYAQTWRLLWSTHQNFFRGLCLAAKVPRVAALAQQRLREGHSVVIGLQATGAAPAVPRLDEGQAVSFLRPGPCCCTAVQCKLLTACLCRSLTQLSQP